MKTLIVGGVAGGASSAARLRRLDEKANIIIFERGEYISFANCGLPYYIGDKITSKSSLVLQTPESFKARFNIDVRTLSEVIEINKENKSITVKDLRTGNTYIETYDNLILSMGAEPIKPPISGINSSKVFSLRNIPDTYSIKEYIEKEVPKKVAVIGGGYIGVEMAENLKEAGLDVTIIELNEHLIASLDFDMAVDVHMYIKSKGINLILKNAVQAIEEQDGGIKIKMQKGEIDSDMLILSVGVKPESKIAQLAGIKVNSRGSIEVNKNMLTSDPNIYAVGDVTATTDFITKTQTFIPLAGPANKQGRIAADNIFGIKSRYEGTQGSSILKVFDMTVATTGINERTAKANNIDYDKIFLYSGSHANYYPGTTNMSIKVIYDKQTSKILGAQIVGFEGVDKRCDVLATAIRLGATAYDLTTLELCYAPPFGSAKDPVNFAGYVIENTLSGKVNNFNWHDVDTLPRDGTVTLLDVRTKQEVASGRIDGFINIPLDNLRQNIDKLNKEKPIYIHCHSGLRSYIACRILSSNGFKTYNLSGGYRLYQAVMSEKSIPDFGCYNCN